MDILYLKTGMIPSKHQTGWPFPRTADRPSSAAPASATTMPEPNPAEMSAAEIRAHNKQLDRKDPYFRLAGRVVGIVRKI